MNKTLSILVIAFFLVSCLGGGSDSEEPRTNIVGAGATFPAPLVTAMADEYRDLTDRRVTVNYQSIGSGGGVRQFMEQTVMFGMSEAYLSDDVMATIESETGGQAFNMPITLADVVLTYNLPSVEQPLVFDGQVLVDIFLGHITEWDDPAIASLNPDVDLPNREITVVHRSDGSGTTNIFTSFLSRVSDEWREQVGFSTSVNWAVGIGGNGNEGVAGTVQNSPGALGYNSLSYALLNDMAYASIVNSSGNVIRPEFEATTEAANIELPEDTRILFTNTPAEQGYPIAGFTWVLVYENLEQNSAIENRLQAEELLDFLVWSMTEGQELAELLGFARIPQAALDRNIEMIRQIKWDGAPVGEEILRKHQLI